MATPFLQLRLPSNLVPGKLLPRYAPLWNHWSEELSFSLEALAPRTPFLPALKLWGRWKMLNYADL